MTNCSHVYTNDDTKPWLNDNNTYRYIRHFNVYFGQ
jgi:hypothetical protein